MFSRDWLSIAALGSRLWDQNFEMLHRNIYETLLATTKKVSRCGAVQYNSTVLCSTIHSTTVCRISFAPTPKHIVTPAPRPISKSHNHVLVHFSPLVYPTVYEAESYSAPHNRLASSSLISSPSPTVIHRLTLLLCSPILRLSTHSPFP